jgi:hypothetical protein
MYAFLVDYLEGGKTSLFSLGRRSIPARSQSKSASTSVLHGCNETNFQSFYKKAPPEDLETRPDQSQFPELL